MKKSLKVMISAVLAVSVFAFSAHGAQVAALKGGVQEVRMNLDAFKYEPIAVQKGVPVRWIIKADSKNLNYCNNAIIVSKYGIEKKLVAGDNIIEFTPSETGVFQYSCWMGMIGSSITVVDDLKKVNKAALDKEELAVVKKGSCPSCAF